jgi:hypothetical protein
VLSLLYFIVILLFILPVSRILVLSETPVTLWNLAFFISAVYEILFVAPWIGMKTHHDAIDMYICLPVRLFEPVGLYHNMSEYEWNSSQNSTFIYSVLCNLNLYTNNICAFDKLVFVLQRLSLKCSIKKAQKRSLS